MKITICGSMQFDPKMTEVKEELLLRGYDVDKPNVVEGHIYEDNLDANAQLRRGFIDEHFAKIDSSEAILVVNEDKNGIEHYIGGNTLIEIAYAYSQGLDIFLLNPVPEVGYADEIRGMHPIVLNGSLDVLDEYVAALPLVYMSTESALKHSAVARAMRKAGISVRVDGKKVASGVNEQPMSFTETYEGAKNRQENLRTLGVVADYLVTVESGLHTMPETGGTYGTVVTIIEPTGDEARVGFALDIEYPREVLDMVPVVYDDAGVWAQQVHGATEKDPYPYFTHGRMKRRETVEAAVYNVAILLGEERV